MDFGVAIFPTHDAIKPGDGRFGAGPSKIRAAGPSSTTRPSFMTIR